MTDQMMNLQALVEKTPDADLLREMIGFAAQRLMELEVGGLTAAGYGEKSAERLAPSATVTATATGRPAPERATIDRARCCRERQLVGADVLSSP
jgi:hypothetical protein